jgi:ankyrin repeat protein
MDGIWGAASEGDLGEVEWLVGHDPSLLDARTRDGRTPLIVASENGHIGVVRWLLDRGAAIDGDDYGCTALYLASCAGYTPVVALLLERGADPTIATGTGMTPLMVASHYGRTEAGRCLLAHPSAAATINRGDNRGRTALHYACQSGRGEVVRLLLNTAPTPPSPTTTAPPPRPSPRTLPRATGSAWRRWRCGAPSVPNFCPG